MTTVSECMAELDKEDCQHKDAPHQCDCLCNPCRFNNECFSDPKKESKTMKTDAEFNDFQEKLAVAGFLDDVAEKIRQGSCVEFTLAWRRGTNQVKGNTTLKPHNILKNVTVNFVKDEDGAETGK